MGLVLNSIVMLLTFGELLLGYAYGKLFFGEQEHLIFRKSELYISTAIIAVLEGGYRCYELQKVSVMIVSISIYMTIVWCVLEKRKEFNIIAIFLLYNIVICLLDLAGMAGDLLSFFKGEISISNRIDAISVLVLTRLIIVMLYMLIKEIICEYDEIKSILPNRVIWFLIAIGNIGVYVFREIYLVNENPEILIGIFMFLLLFISCVALYFYFLVHNMKKEKNI